LVKQSNETSFNQLEKFQIKRRDEYHVIRSSTGNFLTISENGKWLFKNSISKDSLFKIISSERPVIDPGSDKYININLISIEQVVQNDIKYTLSIGYQSIQPDLSNLSIQLENKENICEKLSFKMTEPVNNMIFSLYDGKKEISKTVLNIDQTYYKKGNSKYYY
jgi:hypothetical protein